ncbi:(2Fe-2S)-binding protein [Variovorax sp. LjRoot290]|uniref:(2Fe-2S)-binding protein n=1 Tax=unclassified Variovorax TaxID=663243 RepID=UPI003ECD784F
MDEFHAVTLTVNGQVRRCSVAARTSAADFIRHDLGLTGTHIGCEHGVCGTCTVVVDGEVVRSCLMFAVQLEGCVVETIEGATQSGRVRGLQNAFVECNALQCGFCTPGMLLTAAEFTAKTPTPTRQQIRDALSGNLCRCTGYEAIVNAVELDLQRRP